MSFAKLAESPFIKGNDIVTPITVTIESTRETVFKSPDTGEEQTCGVLKFYDMDKELILNKTNLIYLLGALGDDERQWVNKEITIRTIQMRNQTGQLVRRIFVETPQAATTPKASGFGRQKPAPPTDDVPSSWPSDTTPAAEVTLEAEAGGQWQEGDPIPDPGLPMSAKRRK